METHFVDANVQVIWRISVVGRSFAVVPLLDARDMLTMCEKRFKALARFFAHSQPKHQHSHSPTLHTPHTHTHTHTPIFVLQLIWMNWISEKFLMRKFQSKIRFITKPLLAEYHTCCVATNIWFINHEKVMIFILFFISFQCVLKRGLFEMGMHISHSKLYTHTHTLVHGICLGFILCGTLSNVYNTCYSILGSVEYLWKCEVNL